MSIIRGSRPRMINIDIREADGGLRSFLSGRVSKVETRFKVFSRSGKMVSVFTWIFYISEQTRSDRSKILTSHLMLV